MTSPERRKMILGLLDQAQAAGARLRLACQTIDLCERTVQRWREDARGPMDRRTLTHNSPPHRLSMEERSAVLAIANSAEFGHLPPSQIVPRLADQNIYIASESTFYRLLRQANQLAHRRSERPSVERHQPKPICATAPNQCYSWDITYLPTAVRGQYFYLYLHTDIFSRKIVGWAVHEIECNKLASALLHAIYQREGIAPATLTLHSDNGAAMKGATLLSTLQTLGVMPSRSRPACSDDNPFIEALFRTLKYRPDLPVKPFADITQAKAWVEQLVHWYNLQHRHSAIRFVTPDQRHAGLDKTILQRRHALYQTAKQNHPQRWARSTRNWQPITSVHLNPTKIKTSEATKSTPAAIH